MVFDSVKLINYRNVDAQRIEFEPGVNILVGANAQGKTNVLEAQYTFACGKSFRAATEQEVIEFGRDACEIEADIDAAGRSERLCVRVSRGQRRSLMRNGIKCTALYEFYGACRAVLFVPDHLELVKSSPELRRRFVDMACVQLLPRYASSLSDYNRALSQRNALLRQLRSSFGVLTPQGVIQLETWNDKLAVLAAEITGVRAAYAEQLSLYAPDYYTDMSKREDHPGDSEAGRLGLRYVSQLCQDEMGEPALMVNLQDRKQVSGEYAQRLAGNMSRELAAGVTLWGPHHDELELMLGGHKARNFGSQGQIRSIVLALKLAEGEISRERDPDGEYPVFLLDDILSELDADRQHYILSELGGRQVVLTGCDANIFPTRLRGNVIRVEDGKYKKM